MRGMRKFVYENASHLSDYFIVLGVGENGLMRDDVTNAETKESWFMIREVKKRMGLI